MANARFDVPVERVAALRRQRFTWGAIARQLSTSRQTLNAWRTRVFFEDPLANELDDDDLDDLVRGIVAENTQIGEVTIDSHLFGVHGVNVARARLRGAIKRVDPEGVAARREVRGSMGGNAGATATFWCCPPCDPFHLLLPPPPTRPPAPPPCGRRSARK